MVAAFGVFDHEQQLLLAGNIDLDRQRFLAAAYEHTPYWRGVMADHGIRPDDILFQIGRWYVTDLDRLGAILEDVKPGQALQIGILRGNEGALTTIRTRSIDTSPPAGRKART